MRTLTFAKKAQLFYQGLIAPSNLPAGIDTLDLYANKESKNCADIFLNKYFADTKKRVLVIGINPGRFGAGVTGVPFTDPTALHESCGIENGFSKKRELSSQFIYSFIEEWGGAQEFYNDFFLTSVSPLGFTRNGLNYNYYDDGELLGLVRPFIAHTLKQQRRLGVRDACIILGTGKNQKIFADLNNELGLFKKVYAVEHPRFIMQYRRKHLRDYLDKYAGVFAKALSG